ncbi:hypothetical protein [Porphyromonas somerae]|uniref:hypothetical protein n=1 Tax=Porphyromonas somerae TaxID=322095 RepID=UPI001FCB0334|nr:hypothetical protein [Porphyromonas somerae]BDE81831.1 hypothetical protein CE91St14_08590 [Porphyromonas somerae]
MKSDEVKNKDTVTTTDEVASDTTPPKSKDRITIKEFLHNVIGNNWGKRSKNQRLLIIIILAVALIINYILLL